MVCKYHLWLLDAFYDLHLAMQVGNNSTCYWFPILFAWYLEYDAFGTLNFEQYKTIHDFHKNMWPVIYFLKRTLGLLFFTVLVMHNFTHVSIGKMRVILPQQKFTVSYWSNSGGYCAQNDPYFANRWFCSAHAKLQSFDSFFIRSAKNIYRILFLTYVFILLAQF